MEYDKELLKILESLVVKVIDENGDEINYNYLEIRLETSKYSSSHSPSPTLVIDNEKYYFKNNNMKIVYKCLCGHENTILLKRFLTKKTLNCQHCRETEEKKKMA